MVLLTIFAFVAGAITAVSPCVLPVLPAILGAGAIGGRRRPAGVVLGLAITFTVTIVGLSELLMRAGLGDDGLRDLAVVALGVFGLALIAPKVAARIEGRLSRLARLGPRDTGHGFWSGLLVGGALGFVYAPCAGPILAAVITVSAVSGRTVVLGVAYSLGTALVLLAITLLGRRVLARARGHVGQIQRATGAIMVLTAVAMAFQLDVRLQEQIARHLPAAIANPASVVEDSGPVVTSLDDVFSHGRYTRAQVPVGDGTRLRDWGSAPPFAGTQRWFNTPGGRPLTMAGLRGRVVLIDFWTYTCINCIRTLPYLKAWDDRYRKAGLTIVGVHSPEFSFEKDAGNVAKAVRADGLRYPVVQDNDLQTWSEWDNRVWPADYLVDARGRIRYAAFGEGETDDIENAIRILLDERGSSPGDRAAPKGAVTPTALATPEIYLGTRRADRLDPAPRRGELVYRPLMPADLPADQVTPSGVWRFGPEAGTAVRAAHLLARVRAKDVYAVLSPGTKHRREVRVRVDGTPRGTISVTSQALYPVASFGRPGEHLVELDLDAGTSAFTLTFG